MTSSEKQELLNKLYTEKLDLKSQLSDSDYKVIKCAECKAAELPLPYDIDALHTERQALRDRINEVEDEIEKIEAVEPEDEDIHPIKNNGNGGNTNSTSPTDLGQEEME